jgi:hypothetical protein
MEKEEGRYGAWFSPVISGRFRREMRKVLRMQNLTASRELMEMRNNIRQAVNALDVCWKCQNVSECSKFVLGHTVLVWLCEGCLCEMEKQHPERPQIRSRAALQKLPSAWKGQP